MRRFNQVAPQQARRIHGIGCLRQHFDAGGPAFCPSLHPYEPHLAPVFEQRARELRLSYLREQAPYPVDRAGAPASPLRSVTSGARVLALAPELAQQPAEAGQRSRPGQQPHDHQPQPHEDQRNRESRYGLAHARAHPHRSSWPGRRGKEGRSGAIPDQEC